MNLLMLISALLSALTGVGAMARQPEIAQAVAQVATASERVQVTVGPRTLRPLGVSLTLEDVATPNLSLAFAIRPMIALWTSRRRE